LIGTGSHFIEQGGQQHFWRQGLGRLQQRHRRQAELCIHGLQRGNEVGPEANGIVVAIIERKPAEFWIVDFGLWILGCIHAPSTIQNLKSKMVNPCTQKCRFAKTGRGADHGQLFRQSVV
jgi:hypothetical protein